ncbi:MAG: 3-deoxy-manno-octulosonate cytidylyltransferase [Planctomycetes bacterium]|nr:3-deoxy-manno-octulosonate cytidylyltransferase [Planctomycetota bacterium]MBI3847510.1 3-deoxy-manno-octulosonate cytidylyltransferase [Planctomycetota bacterium]
MSSPLAIVVVPVSLGSTRLPGKALLAETGRPLFVHVVERARLARRASRVIVATDEPRIADVARANEIEVRITGNARTGSDRVWDAVSQSTDERVVVNLQGDEPLIHPDDVDRVIEEASVSSPRVDVVTLAQRIDDEAEVADPNVVKVVIGESGRALYFSRAAIPFRRDPAAHPAGAGTPLFHHRGIYAFQRASLGRFASLPTSRLEELEKLEQLRALGAGLTFRVIVTEHYGFGINSSEDYRRFVDVWKRSPVQAGAKSGG